jgi:phosphoglycolate phosphatase
MSSPPPRVGSGLCSVNARNAREQVKRLADFPLAIERPRVAFVDLDGTLLGPGGSLFASAGGGSSLRAARAVEDLREAGVDLVPTSGRSRSGMFEPARMLGARAYIAELGALLVEQILPEEIVVRNFGAFDGAGSPFLEMARSGAGAYLLERFRGRIEPHTPWSRRRREATMLFRGLVDATEADAALAEAGYDWLRLRDNGRVARSSPTLAGVEARAYHLVPRGVSKASAAALYLRRRGVAPTRAVAIGDSAADLEIGGEVAAVVIVANGVAGLDRGAAGAERARSTDASDGDGFAEAVAALLRPG